MSKVKALKIVANSRVLGIFSKIDIFRLDLGFNLTGPVDLKAKGEPLKIKIADPFIKKYRADYNRIINKYGDIGSLKFYSDENLNMNEMYVFDDENIYEIDLIYDEIKNSARKYLSSIIEKIHTHKNMTNISKKPINENLTYGNYEPEENNAPKLNLPKDEFIRQMVNFHQKQFK
jgi:hypothetical protein